MNEAHLHLLVNHFPILGIIFGLGILIGGIFLKNNSIKNTAYCLFIVASLLAFASMNTGEGAEEIVEKLPGVTDEIIHVHEEAAEKFALCAYLLGLVSIAGLYTSLKRHSQAKLVSFLAITIAAVAVFLAQQTGTSGGEVRHTEIRENTSVSQDANGENEVGEEE